jgi:hypothetical protein
MGLDLSYLFQTFAKKFVQELKDKVRSRVGIDGQGYSQLKNPSMTVTKSGKKKGTLRKRNQNTRLNDTGNFADNFVVGESSDFGLTISGNDATHPTGISYSDIVSYNNKGNSLCNPDIDSPPLIFPNNIEEVKMLQTYTDFDKALRDAVRIQLGEAASLNIKETIVVGK